MVDINQDGWNRDADSVTGKLELGAIFCVKMFKNNQLIRFGCVGHLTAQGLRY
jgi:hypothetical protein